MLHSSRSGIAGRDSLAEYRACRNYAMRNPDRLGWHASIGPDVVAVHMSPWRWGWNCGDESGDWLAAEFAQANRGDPIEDSQIDAYCWWVENIALKAWPKLPHVLKMHSEIEQGKREGKDDPYPRGSAEGEAFKQRICQRLGW